jgi:hypothetical protein
MTFALNSRWRSISRVATSLIMIFILAAGTTVVLAQTETGQIVGEVKDPTGAVIPGATVVLRSTTRGAERRTTTNEIGTYVFANLLPDVYDVTAEATGFAPATQRVQVTVGARVSANIELAAQAVAEQVTVSARRAAELQPQQPLSRVRILLPGCVAGTPQPDARSRSSLRLFRGPAQQGRGARLELLLRAWK